MLFPAIAAQEKLNKCPRHTVVARFACFLIKSPPAVRLFSIYRRTSSMQAQILGQITAFYLPFPLFQP